MDFSLIDLQIILELVSEAYKNAFEEYNNIKDNYKFSRMLDYQILRKKVNEILLERKQNA